MCKIHLLHDNKLQIGFVPRTNKSLTQSCTRELVDSFKKKKAQNATLALSAVLFSANEMCV